MVGLRVVTGLKTIPRLKYIYIIKLSSRIFLFLGHWTKFNLFVCLTVIFLLYLFIFLFCLYLLYSTNCLWAYIFVSLESNLKWLWSEVKVTCTAGKQGKGNGGFIVCQHQNFIFGRICHVTCILKYFHVCFHTYHRLG